MLTSVKTAVSSHFDSLLSYFSSCQMALERTRSFCLHNFDGELNHCTPRGQEIALPGKWLGSPSEDPSRELRALGRCWVAPPTAAPPHTWRRRRLWGAGQHTSQGISSSKPLYSELRALWDLPESSLRASPRVRQFLYLS